MEQTPYSLKGMNGGLHHITGKIQFIYTPHDVNAAYEAGSCFGNRFIAFKDVPVNSNIQLSNQDYWTEFGPAPTEPKKKIENYLVGCAAIIFNEKEEVLIGRRLDFDGNEVWALFGGKPEWNESLAEGLAREIWEELHIAVHPSAYHFVAMKEAFASKTQRCITAYYAIKLNSKESDNVVNREPHKCFELDWASMSDSRVLKLWQHSYPQCVSAREMNVNWALR